MPTRRSSSRAGSEEAKEGLLPQHEASSTGGAPVKLGQWRALLARYQWALAGVAVGFALLMLYTFFPSHVPDGPPGIPGVATHPSNLHVLLTASQTDLSICRTLASSMILGYPSPALVNWENDGTIADGIRDFFATLDSARDNDVVLILQNDDPWMQLRPSTLLERYFKANQQADMFIKTRLGKAAAKNGIRQNIILGAQKDCSFHDSSDPACAAAPQSPLSPSIYEANADYRPRFLDSGFLLGNLRSMRELFLRVTEEPSTKSLQHALSDVFAEQEIYREILRRDSAFNKKNLAIKKEDLDNIRTKMAKSKNTKLDYGIGLDYYNQIGLNTAFAKDQIDTLAFENPTALQLARDSHGIPTNAGTNQLSADIANTLPPYWTFTNEPTLPRWKHWAETPLFTNLWTAVAPVFVYHNGHGDTSKPARDSTFEKAWFRTKGRHLIDASIYTPLVPVAVAGENATMMREFWPFDTWKGGARDAKGDADKYEGYWWRFDEQCLGFHQQIFSDGQGPWALPENH